MKGIITRFAAVGVPGLGFLIAGVLNAEYPAAVLGGVLVIGLVYDLNRKRVRTVGHSDRQRQRVSFALAGIIGASFAITGFVSHGYWLATSGTAIFIGSLLRLYRTTPGDAS